MTWIIGAIVLYLLVNLALSIWVFEDDFTLRGRVLFMVVGLPVIVVGTIMGFTEFVLPRLPNLFKWRPKYRIAKEDRERTRWLLFAIGWGMFIGSRLLIADSMLSMVKNIAIFLVLQGASLTLGDWLRTRSKAQQMIARKEIVRQSVESLLKTYGIAAVKQYYMQKLGEAGLTKNIEQMTIILLSLDIIEEKIAASKEKAEAIKAKQEEEEADENPLEPGEYDDYYDEGDLKCSLCGFVGDQQDMEVHMEDEHGYDPPGTPPPTDPFMSIDIESKT